MESEDFVLLLHLARKGGISGKFETSTSRVAKELNTSQQTISRKVRRLAGQQLIESRASPNGIEVSFTEKGRKLLNEKYLELQGIFSAKKIQGIEGKVVTGKGEGKYFLSFEQYSGKITEKFGFKPFLGTLNLQVEQSRLEQFSASLDKIYIEGFELPGRTFGGLYAAKIIINNEVEGALVFPERTNLPKNIAEIIAPINLRKKFSLKDGNKVKLNGGVQ
jgi:riboflavin kinase